MRAHRWPFMSVVAVMAVLVTFCASGSSLTASAATSAPGVTKTTITVGMETDITGIASSTFATSGGGALAAFDAQNAAGGVDGRKLKLDVENTASSPTGASTAAQVLVNKGVFGIVAVSALFFAGANYLHKDGVPVTGSDLDGPEWNTQPNTNMFANTGSASPTYPAYTNTGKFWKSVGATKVSIVDSTTPSSSVAVKDAEASFAKEGLSTCADATIPLGGVDLTGIALAIKQAGCQAAECSCVLSSSLALATALENLGLHIPVEFAAGPSQQILESKTTEKEATGALFPVEARYSGAAYNTFIDALKKYDPAYKGGLPTLGVLEGWISAGLFIKGLQVAGSNPTRTSFITNLRKVSSWNDNGLLPTSVAFTHFGQAPKSECASFDIFKDGKYAPYPANGKPTCGTLIPNSNAA